MSSSRITCFTCYKQIVTTPRYCCDPLKYFCPSCAAAKCFICGFARTHLHSSAKLSFRPIKTNKCCNCGRLEDVPSTCKFFYEEKCKLYYCHSCILVFYQKYCLMIDKFQRQFGNMPEMQVELRCGCEIETNIIIDYAKKYCYDCSSTIQGRSMLLKNQCKIMMKCFDLIKKEAQTTSINKGKVQKAKSLFYQIRTLIMTCNSCKYLIDGDKVQFGQKIGDIYICNACLKISKQAEKLYAKKSDQKKKQIGRQQIEAKIQQKKDAEMLQKREEERMQRREAERRQAEKQQRKQINKLQKREAEKEQDQDLLNKPKAPPANPDAKTPYKCQICQTGISRLFLSQMICVKCYRNIADGKDCEIGEEHPNKSKINSVEEYQIVKSKPESPKKEIQKSSIKAKMQEPKPLDQSEQASLLQLKSPFQSKLSPRVPAKIKENEMIPKPKLMELSEEDEIEPELPISAPSDNLGSKMHPQFYQPPSVTLIIQQPSQVFPCSQCNYEVTSDNCFHVYRREPSKEQTTRIASTEEEMNQYRKENRLQVFCKGCYLKLKQKLNKWKSYRLEEERRRSQQGIRYGYSAPKRDPKKENAVAGFAQAAAGKIGAFDQNYYKGPLDQSKRLTDITVKSPSLIKKNIAQKQVSNISKLCIFCQRQKGLQDFKSERNMCKDCEIDYLERSLKEKQEDEFKRFKCIKCKRTFNVSVKDAGTSGYCSACLTNAHVKK